MAVEVVPVSMPEGTKVPRCTAKHPAERRVLEGIRGDRRPGESDDQPSRKETADFLVESFRRVGTLDPSRLAALAMLHFALEAAPGFLQAALKPCAFSVIEVPATWCELIGAWWKEFTAAPEEAEPQPDTQVADAFQPRHPTCCALVVTSGQQARAKLDEQLREALVRRRPIIGISPAPDRLLPGDLLLAEQRRMVVPAPDGRLLALLATMVVSQGGAFKANPPSPPAILVDGGRVTPNMLSLARAPSQTAAEYLERLAVMVARRDGGEDKRNRAAVTLADLPGLGAAGRWAERAVVDLRAYASGALPWSEVDRGIVLEGPPGCGKSTFARPGEQRGDRLPGRLTRAVAGRTRGASRASARSHAEDFRRGSRCCAMHPAHRRDRRLGVPGLGPARPAGLRHPSGQRPAGTARWQREAGRSAGGRRLQ